MDLIFKRSLEAFGKGEREFVHELAVEHGQGLGGNDGGETGWTGDVALGGIEGGEDGEFDGAFRMDVDGTAIGITVLGFAPHIVGLGGGGEDSLRHFGAYGRPCHFEIELAGEGEVAVPDFFGAQAAGVVSPVELVGGVDLEGVFAMLGRHLVGGAGEHEPENVFLAPA